MRFYRYLYVSELMKGKQDKIVERLKKQDYPLTVYLIVLSEDGENQLEFFRTSLLKQEIFRGEELFVVGIAAGYDDALYLVERITEDAYRETKDADIRSYLLERDGQER